MSLANGSMTILPGTTVVIQGPIVYTLAPGASLENNGSMDLGTEARLEEPVGGPITGIGTERCELPLSNGVTDQQPGGLGLTVSIPANSGTLTLTRGHMPRSAGGPVQSIARWYGLTAPTLDDVPFSVSLRLDATELNGLSPDVLSIHISASLAGPWADIPTVNDAVALTLATSLVGTSTYLTAFDPDQTTALAGIAPSGPFRIWPTAAHEVIYVQALAPVDLTRIEVLDASGRTISVVENGAFAEAPFTVNVSTLPSGCYLLRINAMYVQRFVKS